MCNFCAEGKLAVTESVTGNFPSAQKLHVLISVTGNFPSAQKLHMLISICDRQFSFSTEVAHANICHRIN